MELEPVPSVLRELPDSAIPSGWRKLSLGEIGEFSTSSVNKKEKAGESRVRLVNYMDVYRHRIIDHRLNLMTVTAPKSQIERSQVQVGDILFTPSSETPADIGHSAVVLEELPDTLHSYHTVRLRPSSNRLLDRGFSGWFANAPAVLRQFTRRSTGSTRFTLNLADFREVKVLLPPLPEQRKIAAILSSVDDAIAATRKVIEQTKRVKQGLLQTLMTRGIGHTRFKKTEIGELPEEWEAVLIEEVANRGSGHTPSKKNPDYWDGEIRWVSLADSHSLDRVYLSDTEKTITPAGVANSSAVLHPEGTVFVSRDASVGRSAIAGRELAVSQHFIAWQCGTRLNNHFFYYFLQYHKPQLERLAVGSTIKTIGLRYFQRLTIPLPPLREQKRIASVLLAHDRVEWSGESNVASLEVLKRGLMQDLLTGRVRVQPD